MCAESKILTGLLERRALESAIGELAAISDPGRLAEQAESIAQQGAPALAALIAALDTADPQLRGGLGQVALRLPREQVVAALRSAAHAHDRSLQARLSALTVLERFFDEQPDEALLASLQSSDEIALRSLSELVTAMTQDPLSILEYLVQLGQQPPEVQRMILQAIPAAPVSSHLVTLLRMFAQDPDPRLASDALEQLGRIRKPSAVRALTGLAATLPPPLATMATRGVRKLRMSGIALTDDDATDAPWYMPALRWRVLMSPVDGIGAQLLWFVGHAPADEQALVVSVMLEDARGLTNASASLDVPSADLPPARPTGHLHHLAVGQPSIPLLLLEAPFETGRRALRAALAVNWESNTPTPLAYRLSSLPIWLAEPDEDGTLSGAAPNELTGVGDTADLLNHPAFWGWVWPVEDRPHPVTDSGETAASSVEPLSRAGGSAGDERAELVKRLVRSQFSPGVVASYRRRLARMVDWLALAGETSAAALAQAASDELGAGRPEESSFLCRLVDIGLQASKLAQRRLRTRR